VDEREHLAAVVGREQVDIRGHEVSWWSGLAGYEAGSGRGEMVAAGGAELPESCLGRLTPPFASATGRR